MAYTKTEWRNGETSLSADNFNHMENGIEAAHERADSCYTRNEADRKFRDIEDSYNRQQVIDAIYPVGSIYMSVNNVNPSNFFGGTWVAWGKGKVPVGVDTSDTSFNSVEKTGGNKNTVLPSHNHTATFTGTEVPAHTHTGPSHTHNYAKANSPSGSTVLNVGQIPSHYHYLDVEIEKAQPWDLESSFPIDAYKASASDPRNWQRSLTEGFGEGHTHTIGTTSVASSAAGTGNTGAGGKHTPAGSVSVAATGGSATNANLQPYITCYMWKRTAL